MDTPYQLLEWNPVQVGSTFQGGGVCIEKSIPSGRGGGSVLKNPGAGHGPVSLPEAFGW